MPQAKSSDIDTAVIMKLQADAELKALLPDGVWYDTAPQNLKRFVIVSLIEAIDQSVYGMRAIEQNLYLVKGVGLSTLLTTAQSNTAADRIDDLLDGQPLTIPNYTFVDCYRDPNQARIRTAPFDQVDASLRWLHAGGFYRVRVSLPGA